MQFIIKHFITVLLLVLTFTSSEAAIAITQAPPLERAADQIKANKSDLALAVLSAYHPSQEERSRYHHLYAKALLQSKQDYESIEHFRMAYIYASVDPEREQLLLERADVYARIGFHTEAAVCYDVLIRKFPNSSLIAQAELGIAESRYRLGEYRDALVHYEKAGSSLRISYGKANTLQALGRTAEAHAIYLDLLEKDPAAINSSDDTKYHLAENFRRSGKLSESKIYFNSVRDPVLKLKATIGLGLIALDERRHAAAAAFFDSAAESTDRTVKRQAKLHSADASMRMGRYDVATAGLLELRKNHPYGSQYDSAALLLARIYKEQGKFQEGFGMLKELIYKRTPSSDALDEIESLLLAAQNGNNEDFVKLWQAAGRWLLDPSRSASLVRLARGLRHSGKPFIEVCTWLIKYGPEDAKSAGRLLLADFYANFGDTEIASGYLKRAKVRGHNDAALRIKARIELMDGKPVPASEAIMALERPQSSDIFLLFDAMRAMKEAGPLQRAVDFCDRHFQKNPAPVGTYVILADLLATGGLDEDALRYYKAVVDNSPAPGARDDGQADREWAHYRIASLSTGEDRVASLKSLQKARGAVGRFAEAELKSATLKRKDP